MIDGLIVVALLLAGWPALQYARNVGRYRILPCSEERPLTPNPSPAKPGEGDRRCLRCVSILIPARNEEAGICNAITAALASEGVELEVIVLDDQSEDRTAVIVESTAQRDSRLRLLHGQPLPAGWAGKQFACHTLAQHASHEHLLFIDADVRLAPDAAGRLIAFLHATECGLVSGVPRQETGTFLERLLIPLIHFLLLGFLPMGRMRDLRLPSLGAGCGQLFLTTKAAYHQAGGHEAIKASFHDGVQLPRAYRRAGLWTDLCDATDLATCRMYQTSREVWNGLAKNAGEGIGSPLGIWIWTPLLAVGHIVPIALLTIFAWLTQLQLALVVFAIGLSYYPRIDAAVRFHQSIVGAALHPLGIATLLAIQWCAFFRRFFGQPMGWKGRPQPKRN